MCSPHRNGEGAICPDYDIFEPVQNEWQYVDVRDSPDYMGDSLELDDTVVRNIEETCNQEHCRLLSKLYTLQGGRNIFKQFFPTDISDANKPDKHGDTFLSNGRYARRLENQSFKIRVPYSYSKYTPNVGRLYAVSVGQGVGGQQMLTRNVRVFLQHGIYRDYDMIAAWWSILLLLCEKHDLECSCLKEFVELCHSNRRQEFLKRNN